MKSLLIYQIAIATPLRRLFDYLPPSHELGALLVQGHRVLVPFGNRKEIGIVVGTTNDSEFPLEKLKRIERVLDQIPAISADLMDLCRWASRYYHYSPGEVYHHALPTALRNRANPAEETEILWRATEKGQVIRLESLSRSTRQQEALQQLRDCPQGMSASMLKHLGIPSAILKALADKQLVVSNHHTVLDATIAATSAESPTQWLAEPQLSANPEQQAALDAICSHQGFKVWLLEGVTGSGKTEVYLQAIAHCVQQGHQALVLVPEIGLTPQTIGRFQRRFRVPIAALHSGLSDRERLHAWRNSKSGKARIIIGTRSAVFAAVPQLGLIVIDEEHDTSFKQQSGFRYHARDVAVMRARQQNIPIILGSATPSLESLHNANLCRYETLLLQNRAGNATRPLYQIVDIKAQKLTEGISEPALKAATSCLKRGEQVLFFMNRRGYAPVLLCHDCGWHGQCENCDAHLTLHRNPTHLHCHHCSAHRAVPHFCEACGSSDLRAIGQGTERIEDTLQNLFPEHAIVRIDRDAVRSAERMHQQFGVIHSGKPALLVGTQMLAKGHHFPNVTLVVILNVDAGLFSGDFRGLEYTAQLIEQVAGRAGRGDKRGQVLLQTHHPEHPSIKLLVQHGYHALAESLLFERQLVSLPPFSHLAVVRAEAQTPDVARDFLRAALAQGNAILLASRPPQSNATQSHATQSYATPSNATPSATNQGPPEQDVPEPEDELELLGPIPATLGRKSGHYRFQLVLKSQHRPALHRFIQRWLAVVESLAPRTVRWHLDVDPVQMDD
ncbi:Primosomal protein N\' [gamma proteobacterium HdN1]|nr:Primosomal protein N\' [gamma proteobacterium HdN1]